MPRYSASQWEQMVTAYLNGASLGEAAAIFGAHPSGVQYHLRKIGVPTRSNFIDLGSESKLVADYAAGRSSEAIANDLGCSGAAVCRRLKLMGVNLRPRNERRKYALNEAAFAVPSDEAAYWLGFILTDGNIHIQDRSRYALNVTVADRDREHLLELQRFLGTDRPLYESSSVSPATGRQCRAVALTVSSRRLVADLVRHGIQPAKTYIATVPHQMADNIHFWRGCVDGDGWITPCSSYGRHLRRYSLGLCGMLPVCQSFADFVNRRYGYKPVAPHRNNTIWSTVTNGVRAACLAGDLYATGPALPRKKRLAEMAVRSYIDNPPRPYSLRRLLQPLVAPVDRPCHRPV